MAYYQISGFYYDDTNDNVFIYITKPVGVSYEHYEDQVPVDIYEAQIFLDGNSTLIQRWRPPSVDGEVPGGVYGREAHPDGDELLPIDSAPE